MAQATLLTAPPKLNEPIKAIQRWIGSESAKMNTMMGETYDFEVNIPISLHASKTIHHLIAATRACTLKGIRYTPDVAQGGALTACVCKAIGTATPATGTTPMQSSVTGINLMMAL